MKKIWLSSMLLTVMSGQVMAQNYMTRTGKVRFYSATRIENIEAVNNEAASVLNTQTGEIVFQVPVRSFKFDKALMEEHFNENYMESDKFPRADFKGKITDISSVNFSKDGVYDVKAQGKLTMHGVTRDITTTGTITVKGGEVTAYSKFNIKPGDYNIKIPAMVASKIAEQIEITVNSILKAVKK